MEEMRQWYDGYRFGGAEMYCPWDVLNHVAALQVNHRAKPKSYWKNTSHNDIVRKFVGQEDFDVSEKLETLLAGHYIEERIVDDLTYEELFLSEGNLWSVLYLTGYLTEVAGDATDAPEGLIRLVIPNEEVKSILQIRLPHGLWTV